MNSKSKYAALLLSSVLVIYAIVGAKQGHVSAQDSSLQQLDVFSQVFYKIQNDYVDQPSMSAAINGAIRGLLEQVDPYAGYLTAKDVAFYKDFSPEKTVGIGVILGRASGYPIVLSAIPGGPGAKAGLKTFDVIEAIDTVPTREMNLVQVYAYLSTPPDKQASLTLIGRGRDPSDPEILKVGREVTKVPPVEARMVQNDIAYVRVPLLAQGKAADVRKQLEDLVKKGATGVILDLRATAGGKDTEGFALANLFVDSGSLGYLQGQKVPRKQFPADPKAAMTKAPLVVLVDGGTGGAAELTAAAIGDSKRGRLVGMRTFGASSVQSLIPLEGNTALLISTAKYYSPSGTDIQAKGVQPDTKVPDVDLDPNSPDTLDSLTAPKGGQKTDDQLQMEKAIELIRELRSARKAA